MFRGTSNRIQYDVISATATIILNRIKSEVHQTRFIAIVLDETTDVTYFSQLFAVVRYVKTDGNVQERLFGFKKSQKIVQQSLYIKLCLI